jgi:3-oxoacyl-[acyl-carrier-protein] synthase-1/3-oxoacyl-[acyl-carrier-protein] synthase II
VEGRVLSDDFPGVPYLSTKGYTGHTLGAAGAVEAVFTVISLERSLIPASGGFQHPDPEIGGMPVAENTTVEGDYAVSQSLAFGGGNAVVVFGKLGVGK